MRYSCHEASYILVKQQDNFLINYSIKVFVSEFEILSTTRVFFRCARVHTYHTETSWRCWCTSFLYIYIYIYIFRDNRATCRGGLLLYACTLIRIRFIASSMRTRVCIRCISDVSLCEHAPLIRHHIATCDVDFMPFRRHLCSIFAIFSENWYHLSFVILSRRRGGGWGRHNKHNTNKSLIFGI